MVDILDLAERLWNGDEEIASAHPLATNSPLVEIADGVAFVASFARVSAFRTGDGLVLVDTGHELTARHIHAEVRSWSPDRLNTAIFSHGHVDHVLGVGVFEEEAAAKGWTPPTVVAHEALPARFDRYKLTAGYNAVINQRQFQLAEPIWPTEFRYPDRTYATEERFEVGGLGFELHHARGETDDHTWTYVPDRKVLCPGDLFIWASPNAGNPQKVQRYAREWAIALRQMAGLGAEVLLPGHGFPVVGADRVRTALSETAGLLESLVEQTLSLMNAGARLDEILHSVVLPAALLARPYLRPVYDDPEFIVRNIWRQYGGWYDGNPARLKPAPDAAVAAELAALAGGAPVLARRALELVDEAGCRGPGAGPGAGTGAEAGVEEAAREAAREADRDRRLRLAGHLAELAVLAEPADAEVLRAHAEVFEARVEAESSTMAAGIFAWAARQSRAVLPGSA